MRHRSKWPPCCSEPKRAIHLFKREMATYMGMRVKDFATKHIDFTHYTPARNVMMGAGLAYAFSEEKYMHIPMILLVPSVYAGYQAFNNRVKAGDFVRSVVSK